MISVYKISCPVTNEVIYVGQTSKTIDQRLKTHLSSSTSKVKQWYMLNKIVPVVSTIERVLVSEAASRELYWIGKYSNEYKLLNIAGNPKAEKKIPKQRTKPTTGYRLSNTAQYLLLSSPKMLEALAEGFKKSMTAIIKHCRKNDINGLMTRWGCVYMLIENTNLSKDQILESI